MDARSWPTFVNILNDAFNQSETPSNRMYYLDKLDSYSVPSSSPFYVWIEYNGHKKHLWFKATQKFNAAEEPSMQGLLANLPQFFIIDDYLSIQIIDLITQMYRSKPRENPKFQKNFIHDIEKHQAEVIDFITKSGSEVDPKLRYIGTYSSTDGQCFIHMTMYWDAAKKQFLYKILPEKLPHFCKVPCLDGPVILEKLSPKMYIFNLSKDSYLEFNGHMGETIVYEVSNIYNSLLAPAWESTKNKHDDTRGQDKNKLKIYCLEKHDEENGLKTYSLRELDDEFGMCDCKEACGKKNDI